MNVNYLAAAKRLAKSCTAVIAIGAINTVILASTVTYDYDEHGRLDRVTYEDGAYLRYHYDDAGNRMQVETHIVPGEPLSISVPASSATGSYTVSWGTSSGTVTAYELYESTSSDFSSSGIVYSGTSTSKPISGKSSGTYYYRVRACDDTACSAYRTGANGTTVTLPPGIPASISVPSTSSTGNYIVSWGTSSGTVTAYELYEATNSGFSGQTLAYSGTSTSAPISGKGEGTYYYRARACNSSGCSDYRTGANATSVIFAPGVPSSISVPSSSTTGGYTVSWGSSTGTVTAYELYEATNSGFTGESLAYSGTSTSAPISGKGDGTYYYRVRGCNGSGCSGYRTGGNATTVTLPPGIPASISVPSSSTGSHTISWGTASGTVTSYELYQATNSGFSGQTLAYSGTSTSHGASVSSSGTYYYRVRACNSSGCSAYRTGANGVSVTLQIQVLNPAINIPAGGTTVSISTLANLNGNAGTIHSFSTGTCPAGRVIQSGAQSVLLTNLNTYYWQCGGGWEVQCSATYVIRNSGNGQLHNGTSSVTVAADPQDLPPGYECP
jgi:hypothetical protein